MKLLLKCKDLKSGRVNFILPWSVAIFSASGTASSHLDLTHSLSHLEGAQPITKRLYGGEGFKMKVPFIPAERLT